MIFGINTTRDISKLSQISLANTYNNFEISLVVFIPNITTNHAITYTNQQDEQDEDDCFIFLNLDMALKNSTPWKFQIHFLSIFFPAITIVVAYTIGILKILRDCPPYQLTKMLDNLVLVDFAIGNL